MSWRATKPATPRKYLYVDLPNLDPERLGEAVPFNSEFRNEKTATKTRKIASD
jgi:hypothetical protein